MVLVPHEVVGRFDGALVLLVGQLVNDLLDDLELLGDGFHGVELGLVSLLQVLLNGVVELLVVDDALLGSLGGVDLTVNGGSLLQGEASLNLGADEGLVLEGNRVDGVELDLLQLVLLDLELVDSLGGDLLVVALGTLSGEAVVVGQLQTLLAVVKVDGLDDGGPLLLLRDKVVGDFAVSFDVLLHEEVELVAVGELALVTVKTVRGDLFPVELEHADDGTLDVLRPDGVIRVELELGDLKMRH